MKIIINKSTLSFKGLNIFGLIITTKKAMQNSKTVLDISIEREANETEISKKPL